MPLMPPGDQGRPADVTVNPLYGKGGELLSVPRDVLPDGELHPVLAAQIIHDELMLDGNARLNLATFVTTTMEPEARLLMDACIDKNMIDKDEYPQTAELERRCVAMLGHLWHAPDAEVIGCSTTGSSEACDARRDGAQAALAAAPPGRGRGRRPPQPGHGVQRAGVLGEVRQLLGGRAPLRAHGGRALPPGGGGGRGALRREHHRRGRHPRVDLRRVLRAGGRHRRRPRRLPGPHRRRRARARRRGLRRDGRPLHRPRPDLGLPARAGGLDQHLRPQVRPRVPGRGVGAVAPHRLPARGAGVPRRLPGRRHADVRPQLLAPGRPGGGAVLHVHPARVRGLPAGAAGVARRRAAPVVGPRGARAVPAHHRRQRAAGVRLHDDRRRAELHGLRRVARPAGAGLAGARLRLPRQPRRPVRTAVRHPQRVHPRPGRPARRRPRPPAPPPPAQPPEAAETIRPSFHH